MRVLKPPKSLETPEKRQVKEGGPRTSMCTWVLVAPFWFPVTTQQLEDMVETLLQQGDRPGELQEEGRDLDPPSLTFRPQCTPHSAHR